MFSLPAPHEFTAISFPTKALKIILHDVQSGGEAATLTAQGGNYDVDSDDGVGFLNHDRDHHDLSLCRMKIGRKKKQIQV